MPARSAGVNRASGERVDFAPRRGMLGAVAQALRSALLGLLLLSCEKVGDQRAAGLERSEPNVAPRASASGAPRESIAARAVAGGGAPSASEAGSAAKTPTHEPGTADLDAGNDEVVAPPEAIADCEARLQALNVSFTRAELKVHRTAAGLSCGAPQAVLYKGRAGGPRWNPAPLVTCTLALALARFETLADAEAERALGSRLRSITQGGTYNCRKMARFTGMVSEHSYGNAIDLRSFRLSDGRSVSVLEHFGRPSREPSSPEGKFLRALARRAFDEGLFSVVLTEFFDALHRDHFHLDMARYRIDGTR